MLVKLCSLLVAERQWQCPGSVSDVSSFEHAGGEAVEFDSRASGSRYTVGLNLKCVCDSAHRAGTAGRLHAARQTRHSSRERISNKAIKYQGQPPTVSMFDGYETWHHVSLAR
jgi:hypothetical protein